MMAAITAAEKGKHVVLLEKNERPGKKLGITGKGRCNITTSYDIPYIIDNLPGNGKFMYSALNQFSNNDLIDFLVGLGVRVKEERGGRVFPASDNAGQVVDAFIKRLIDTGVDLVVKSRVTNLIIECDRIKKVVCAKHCYTPSGNVVLATGGASYPHTGSSGDGYALAWEAGHRITTPLPSLVGLKTQEDWPAETAGLTLKNVSVALAGEQRQIEQGFGELLFTDFGVSGPVILTLSRTVARMLAQGDTGLYLSIDLKPALDDKQLDARIQRDLTKHGARYYRNSLGNLLPSSLIPIVVRLSAIDPHKRSAHVTRSERLRLRQVLKDMRLTITDTLPISTAIVTQGGVDVDQVDPGTMRSRLIQNLLFAGEILDVDGYTGGFNLQVAFSTGYVAGNNA